MATITEKIDNILKIKNLSRKGLSNLIGCTDGALNQMIREDRPFSKKILEKLLPILEVPREEFETWIIVDKYPKELLELAIKTKKDFPYKRKSILTAKIDAVLEEKGISRTTLAKQIVYSQSGLNRMIIGQISMSKPVMKKVVEALEIPETEILSWIVADRYKLEVLEMAYKLLDS